MTVDFRVNAPELADMLAVIDEKCFSDADAMSGDEWHSLLTMTHHCVVMFKGDEGVMAAAVASHAAGVGYLYSSAVLRKYRQQGYGKELVNLRLNWLRDKCSIVQAHTRVGNIPAQKMLKSLGFVAVQYVPDFYGDFQNGVLWEMAL